MRGIEHELLLTVSFRIDRSHPGDGATIGRRQCSLSARSVHLAGTSSQPESTFSKTYDGLFSQLHCWVYED